MEKNILRQYDSIRNEIEETKRRIQSAEDRLRRIEESSNVKDTVSGGMGGTQHFVIEGFPSRDYTSRKNILMARKEMMAKLLEDSLIIQAKAESYIMNITESEPRRIASFRYIDNLPWRKVAESMGEGYTDDACRKTLDRYLQKN